MRLIHTSDWHLGHELHGFDRGVEHDVFLDWLASRLCDLSPDAVLITGDIYDTANPTISSQHRLYRFLSRVLTDCRHLQVVIIGGNHDSAARLELPKDLLDPERFHLVGAMPRRDGGPALEETLVRLRDAAGEPRAICGAIPYLRPGDMPVAEAGEAGIKAIYREVIDAARRTDATLPLLLTGHLHMSGGAVSEMSERRIVLGGEEAVSASIFPANVAYVALGHLHRPQSIPGQTTIRYAGSPFPMSVTERDYNHSVVIVDIDDDGKAKIDLLPTPRPVAFYRVPSLGSARLPAVEEALGRLAVEDPGEDRRPFLEVAVQLDSAEPELRRRIEAALEGKPVRLTRIVRCTDGRGGALADATLNSVMLNEVDPVQVFARRHEEEYGGPPPDDLVKAFGEVLAGVLSPPDEPPDAT